MFKKLSTIFLLAGSIALSGCTNQQIKGFESTTDQENTAIMEHDY